MLVLRVRNPSSSLIALWTSWTSLFIATTVLVLPVESITSGKAALQSPKLLICPFLCHFGFVLEAAGRGAPCLWGFYTTPAWNSPGAPSAALCPFYGMPALLPALSPRWRRTGSPLPALPLSSSAPPFLSPSPGDSRLSQKPQDLVYFGRVEGDFRVESSEHPKPWVSLLLPPPRSSAPQVREKHYQRRQSLGVKSISAGGQEAGTEL